jgi:hypothetical protein
VGGPTEAWALPNQTLSMGFRGRPALAVNTPSGLVAMRREAQGRRG